MSNVLTKDFILELFKLCLKDKSTLQVVLQHVKYQYLPTDHHKDVLKTISVHYDTLGFPPSIGYLTEAHKAEPKVLEVIAGIKKADLPLKDGIIEQLEVFIRRTMFLHNYEEIGALYNKQQPEKAFELINTLAEELQSFSIRQQLYTRIFSDHTKRHVSRRVNQEVDNGSSFKAPTGIDELDDALNGGLNPGDTFLALAQSGVGKTKLLRYIGVSCARMGLKVLHLQAEGSKEECEDGYDATWSGMRLSDIENATISLDILQKMKKASSNINALGGEIYVEAFEQFDSADLSQARQIITNLIKTVGPIQVLIIDYLELFDPGNGRKYSNAADERKRREAVANGLKNIALEFKIAVFTATQASTVATDLLNNAEFTQTRYHISEFKGAIKPFSVFITLNQTSEEYRNNIMRLYVDKLRKYKGGQLIKLYQRYDRERFYDKKRTLNEIYVK
jgi:KaiC/GvpD/RAD55 family RecA-like ATPase